MLVLPGVLAGLAVFAWLHFRPLGTSGGSNARAALLQSLAEVETGLASGMSPEDMSRLAYSIQSQIQEHPLPPGDEFQFGGELVVRYLRTLAALEGYRRLKLATTHEDPLDPKSPHPNTQAIETYEKYRPRLQQAVHDLRVRLSK